ncbi:EGF-like repeat and discoidin I-like domain-containing protein 3 [Anabarilius grahami]|uniref:EGF-like repeat and discoidin I-like domain-containing protein 3 n=1 Tax=Anabarilius grahami TaxID=495550 RepID=A0A3N0YZB9_ANAGA|nr:EGF-like repeat and discoidin I-like domain-containing protein 3 [Anabarilius grahami]
MYAGRSVEELRAASCCCCCGGRLAANSFKMVDHTPSLVSSQVTTAPERKSERKGSTDAHTMIDRISLGNAASSPYASQYCELHYLENENTKADIALNENNMQNVIPVGEIMSLECSGPLGMEGGIISNQQITASSTHRALFGLQKWYPYFARLNKKGLVNAWTAAENDRWPWIQLLTVFKPSGAVVVNKMQALASFTSGAVGTSSPISAMFGNVVFVNKCNNYELFHLCIQF